MISKEILAIPSTADREVEDGFFFAREGNMSKLSHYIENATTSIDDRDEQVRRNECGVDG